MTAKSDFKSKNKKDAKNKQVKSKADKTKQKQASEDKPNTKNKNVEKAGEKQSEISEQEVKTIIKKTLVDPFNDSNDTNEYEKKVYSTKAKKIEQKTKTKDKKKSVAKNKEVPKKSKSGNTKKRKQLSDKEIKKIIKKTQEEPFKKLKYKKEENKQGVTGTNNKGLNGNQTAKQRKNDCSTLLSQTPGELQTAVNSLSININTLDRRSYRALDRFKDILTSPPVTNSSYQGFFEHMLLNSVIAKAGSLVPGLSLAKSTLLGFIEVEKAGRAATDSKSQSDVHGWISREKANLASLYVFNNVALLQCEYAQKYAAMQTDDERVGLISAVRQFSQGIGQSIPPENLLMIQTLEFWINDHYKSKRQRSEGVIVLKLDLNSDGYSLEFLKVRGSAYSKKVGQALNELMPEYKMRPFDLKVFKIVLMRPKDGCGNCAAAGYLNANNRILEEPSLREAKRPFNELVKFRFQQLGNLQFTN